MILKLESPCEVHQILEELHRFKVGQNLFFLDFHQYNKMCLLTGTRLRNEGDKQLGKKKLEEFLAL